VRLATTLLKVEERARHNPFFAGNYAKYLPILNIFFTGRLGNKPCLIWILRIPPFSIQIHKLKHYAEYEDPVQMEFDLVRYPWPPQVSFKTLHWWSCHGTAPAYLGIAATGQVNFQWAYNQFPIVSTNPTRIFLFTLYFMHVTLINKNPVVLQRSVVSVRHPDFPWRFYNTHFIKLWHLLLL